MLRKYILIISLLFCPILSFGQVRGIVLEEENMQPVVQAAVQLLSPKDSSQVVGTVTDEDGFFSVNVAAGNYLARISYIGMATVSRDVHVPGSRDVDMGRILLSQDALWLDQATVTASVALATMSADTVVYNPAALIVAEDAMLDELLKRIPGIEVDDKGNVVMHGKEVKQLLVNGKKFFGGDVASGLRNIPAEMIESIRAYERASELKRISGIDDGEDEPVIDIRIKPAFFRGWNNRVTAGMGNRWRYAGRLNSNRMTDSSQVTIVASAQNRPSPNSFNEKNTQLGTGSTGDRHKGEAGATFALDKPKADLGGSVHYDYLLRNASTSTLSENIYSTSNTFTSGNGLADAIKHNFKADGLFEFKPDKRWNLLFKPVVTFSRSDNMNSSDNFNYLNDSCLVADRVYHSVNSSRTVQDRLNANLTFQVYHRLSDKGRSISLRTYLEYQNNTDEIMTDNGTRYFRIKSNPDSVRIYKRFQDTEVNQFHSSATLTYNEPLAKGMYLQVLNRVQYRLYLIDKDSYRMEEDYPEWTFSGHRGNACSMLPDGYGQSYDPSQSCNARYDYLADYLTINYRLVRKKFNMTAGVVVVPQYTHISYPDEKVSVGDTATFTISAAPNLSLKWNKSKEEHLSLSYRSNASAVPSAYLLNVPNSNNPLYVRLGNPGLRPAFVHNANLSYDLGSRKKQNSLIVNAYFKLIQNAVSMSTSYDPLSGIRTAMPKNINGNWNTNASVVYNNTFGNSGFSMSTDTKFTYDNSVAFLYDSKRKQDDRNITRRASAVERLNGTYRNKWLELTLNLAGVYIMERSEFRPMMNQTPWALSAGVNAIFRLPWKMTLSSDFSDWTQRGYSYTEFNDDFLIWNARLSQSFLKGKLTFTLDWHDILRQQPNITRSFSAERRTITVEHNAVTSYILFRVSWRFKSRN